MTESSGASQAGAAAPDVERLIDRVSAKLDLVKQALRDNEIDVLNRAHHASWDDIEQLRDALSAALTREAALQSDVDIEREAAQFHHKKAVDAIILQRAAEAREAALRAENERLTAELATERTNHDEEAYNDMTAAKDAAEAHAARLDAVLRETIRRMLKNSELARGMGNAREGTERMKLLHRAMTWGEAAGLVEATLAPSPSPAAAPETQD